MSQHSCGSGVDVHGTVSKKFGFDWQLEVVLLEKCLYTLIGSYSELETVAHLKVCSHLKQCSLFSIKKNAV